jgi:hypothetical protein
MNEAFRCDTHRKKSVLPTSAYPHPKALLLHKNSALDCRMRFTKFVLPAIAWVVWSIWICASASLPNQNTKQVTVAENL